MLRESAVDWLARVRGERAKLRSMNGAARLDGQASRTSRGDWSRRVGRLPGAGRARRSPRLRELARRVGLEAANPRPVAPARPVGAKLELTYSCNLRCGFCYTDSPRRTLERATDLSDEAWRQVVADVIELGILEAVVTGGEPLLRPDLALETLERLDAAGVAVCFNTNGWFLDAKIADRLAALSRVSVHISLDGPTPELHDRARGVPGSWRRAVRAITLLLERGVRVQVVHVVTPDNEAALADLVEQVWLLGVPSLRVAPVVSIGAAARGGDWRVRASPLRRTVERAKREFEAELEVRLDRDPLPGDPILAPAYLVVRPNGAVMGGSVSPFRFGHALEDGVEACWTRIVRDWDHPRVRQWREPILRGGAISDAPVVLYRDDELDLSDPLVARPATPAPALPKPAASTQAPGAGDLYAAHEHVRELALARPYRLGAVRWSAADHGGRYVRTPSGEVTLLNATAALVMDACATGTPARAAETLASRYPGRPRATLERDALGIARRLVRRGVLDPGLALSGRSAVQPSGTTFPV